jgi:hypothetical protein
MQPLLKSHVRGLVGFAGAAGALVSVVMLSGCPGTIDTKIDATGGSTGTGGGATGGSGTGGASATGGTTGTGGTAASNCTGGNDGATIVTNNCATTFCHIPGSANDGACGGLDLTVDANIGSRLVNVTSTGTASNGSMCMSETEPYLVGGSNPATGLVIDKISSAHPPCGSQMPEDSIPLSATQQKCLTQWATTLTSP